MDNVLIYFYCDALGDNIAWIPLFDLYQKRNRCNLFLCVKKFIRDITENQYPNIHFIDENEIKNYKFDKKIDILEKERIFNTELISMGIINFMKHILFPNEKILEEILPKFDLSAPRQIKEPYVCIAVQAHDYIKTWSYPYGWEDVINYLKEILGYKVICIDKNKIENYNFNFKEGERKSIFLNNNFPKGVIDRTGNLPLQNRIDLIKDADFFIGTSSGLSWLAWGCKVPVVMISGFTNPNNEFYTPYRVYPSCGCRDCNSHNIGIKREDFNRCKKVIQIKDEIIPECSMNITPQMVVDKINQIPSAQLRLAEYWKNHPIS